jgi:hypothetical protein
MKLSSKTKKLLKNFTNINTGIVIKKTPDGETSTKLRILENDRHIYAEVVVPEIFDNDICLYDVPTFLNICDAMDDPDLIFNETNVTLLKNKSKTKITYAYPDTIRHPTKDVVFPEPMLTLSLIEDDLEKLFKMCKLVQLDVLKIFSENGKVFIKAENTTNGLSNPYEAEVGDGSLEKPCLLKTERCMKILPGDYKISLHKSYAVFENTTIETLKYVINLEYNA